MAGHVLIFCWHNVTPSPFFGSDGSHLTGGFHRQLRLLERTTTPIPLSDAVDGLIDGTPLPPRASVVTFDDGYRDNLHVAAPILKAEGIPATFFLVPELLSSDEAPWWERLAWAVQARRRTDGFMWRDLTVGAAGSDEDSELYALAAELKTLDESERQQSVKELIELLDPAGREPSSPMMDWDEARRLAEMGFAIGSHSSRHAILSNESAEAQLDDLRQAKDVLERRVGSAVDLLAYPNGTEADFSHVTVSAAARAGYRAALTTIDGWNERGSNPFALRRFVMFPERGPVGFGVVARHLGRELLRSAGLRRRRL